MTTRRLSAPFSIVLVAAAGCGTQSAPGATVTPADSGGVQATAGSSGAGGDSGSAAASGAPSSNDAGVTGALDASSELGAEAGSGESGLATAPTDGSGSSGGEETGGGSTEGGSSGPADSGPAGDGGVPSPAMNFFVSSDTSMTGNLGGLQGADARCQRLATAVGHGDKTWHAYLSADSPVTNARDRIGSGPYYNSLGALVAADITALHARTGDPAVFIDEHGGRINGQWTGSPAPLQHDILTGSTTAGMLNAGMTCTSWTAATGASFVGHADGLGPGMSMAAMYTPWNSSHAAECANTAPLGGAGRIYCFVAN
jgi:hypothetical protein